MMPTGRSLVLSALSVLTLTLASSVLVSRPARAWESWIGPNWSTCEYFHWDWAYQPRIEIRWASNGLSFTSSERQLIRDSIAAYNALPNARIHITEGTTACTGNGPTQVSSSRTEQSAS